MQDIKLRAWDALWQKMVYMTIDDKGIHSSVNPNSPVGQLSSWNPFIGIQDKNGTDIYSGDRLLTKVGNDDSHFYCEVFYNDRKAAYQLKGAFLSGDCYFHEVEECEVIGNIHQHPTLTELIQSN